MGYQDIRLEKEYGVVTVTLNRPFRLNALSLSLRGELEQALDEIEKDDNLKVVIITGAPREDGRPCFSAGADIKEIAEAGVVPAAAKSGTTQEALLKSLRSYGQEYDILQSTFDKLGFFPKPIIAAIDGICTAGGLEFALCCDIRIAAETAQICDLHLKNLAGMGGGGLQTRLPLVAGLSKAKQIAWTGISINGKEAHRFGLVDEVFPPDKMLIEAKKMAGVIASMDLLTLKMSKDVMNNSIGHSIKDSLRYSALCEALLRHMRSNYIDRFKDFAKKPLE